MTWKMATLLSLTAAVGACAATPRPAAPTTRPTTRPTTVSAAGNAKEIQLFDGKTLTNWKSSAFGGEGEVGVENGQIVVHAGATLSGVSWTGPALPTENYEIELDAMKLSGSDFFVGLTFPYKKDCASIILGGWGGSLVGISSVNGNDAANNEWSTARDFKRNVWYHLRLRCTGEKIQAWLNKDEEPFLDLDTTDKQISTRSDIDDAKPLGLTTYQTAAAYKNITLRKL